jgi:hypothetical protein
MIDADELVYMTKEDFLQEIKERQGIIRDLLNDIDVLISRYVNDVNLTAAETAERLRCDISQIPPQIPCVHRGRDYLYKVTDIEKWLRDNKKPRR